MNNFKLIFIFFISLTIFYSCTPGDENLDCNLVENGLALIDDCGECQQALIYDTTSYETSFVADTIGLVLNQDEMLIMPNNPLNPFWNTGCSTGSITELNASAPFDPQTQTSTGDFVKFSFATGGEVSGDNWDIAFRNTTILVNGGDSYSLDQPVRIGNAAAYIANGIMDDIQNVDISNFIQDSNIGPAIVDDSGIPGNGWCAYDMITHIISPQAGKILVFRTHDNKYAKVEILNYYCGDPQTCPYGGFYTFNYVYQPNGEMTF